MCNACGFLCCASDQFGGCGCDCSVAGCAVICSNCHEEGHDADECDYPDDDEDDYAESAL